MAPFTESSGALTGCCAGAPGILNVVPRLGVPAGAGAPGILESEGNPGGIGIDCGAVPGREYPGGRSL